MSGLTFNVVYEDAGDGWVYAHVPEFPEVQTQGERLDQARVMVRDAIKLVLEERPRVVSSVRRQDGRSLSLSRSLSEEARARARLTKHDCSLTVRPPSTSSGNPATGQRTTVPRHREIKPPTARAVCRQLGVPAPLGPRWALSRSVPHLGSTSVRENIRENNARQRHLSTQSGTLVVP